MPEALPQKVCYILSYYAPNYTRTATLVAALKLIPGMQLFEARNETIGVRRYLETFDKLVGIRRKFDPDVYILGFRGYEIFWPVRLLTRGKRLIYDHMMSPYDSLVNETGKLSKGSMPAKAVYHYEKMILHSADTIITDTTLHKEYFCTLFRVEQDKVHAVNVGADEAVFDSSICADIKTTSSPFTILFYGSFLPLHGIDIILHAAARLRELPIKFLLVGGNRIDLTDFRQSVQSMGLSNVIHKEWVDYYKLPELLCNADLCIGGPLGNTGQAQRVITGKTFQAMAMGCPVIVGKIREDFGFVHNKNCLLVEQGSVEILTETILWAYRFRRCLPEIGRAGRQLYRQRFSTESISYQLRDLLEQ